MALAAAPRVGYTPDPDACGWNLPVNDRMPIPSHLGPMIVLKLPSCRCSPSHRSESCRRLLCHRGSCRASSRATLALIAAGFAISETTDRTTPAVQNEPRGVRVP